MRELPEILVVEDIAELLGISAGAARRLVSRGACEPYSRLGKNGMTGRDRRQVDHGVASEESKAN